MATIKDEFIGEEIEIVASNNPSLKGLKGTIIDETRETFKIKTSNTNDKTNAIKTVMKKGNTFNIGKTIINGDTIAKRPEERIKLK
jgi:RNase P/RNase MRP subunit p29